MRAYIDSDVFVSCVMEKEKNHIKSKEFIDFITSTNLKNDILFFTSRFTEVEVASAVFRRSKNEDKARATLQKMERPWSNKIFPLPEKPNKRIKIDDLVIKLVETAIRYGTKFGDTVHANDVESYALEYLVTWNKKDFKVLKEKISSLKVVDPEEMLVILKENIKN